MPIILKRLASLGLAKAPAIIEFDPLANLVRGPSDTGKSYIRDCLWYLLGGDKVPKPIPESAGYDSLILAFASGEVDYLIVRGLRGGAARILTTEVQSQGIAISSTDDTVLAAPITKEAVDLEQISPNAHAWLPGARDYYDALESDPSKLIVSLSGAEGKQILRSASNRGPVTGGDVRHWFLLAQTAMISDEPPSGQNYTEKPQRLAALSLFVTGIDDSAVVLAPSSREQNVLQGQVQAIEDSLKRIASLIPSEINKPQVSEAIERIDATLEEISKQNESRSHQLKHVRSELAGLSTKLQEAKGVAEHSRTMLARFELLDAKYESDVARLRAIAEGVSLFAAYEETPCPLCLTPLSQQMAGPSQLPAEHLVALRAEAAKIAALRVGLQESIRAEQARNETATARVADISARLTIIERHESAILAAARGGDGASPKLLAVRRSEYSSLLDAFDEWERLASELERLKNKKRVRSTKTHRESSQASSAISNVVKQLLNEWGFEEVDSVVFDLELGDIRVNHRARLEYGAGTRSVYLMAFAIAVMQYSLSSGFPHLGALVIDSPLKAYADRDGPIGVDPVTVAQKFYSWLAHWQGPGQITILENEKIASDTALRFNAIQFTRRNDIGRAGFYLVSADPLKPGDEFQVDATEPDGGPQKPAEDLS
jgi:hypothetical protein